MDVAHPLKIHGVGPQPQIKYPICTLSALGNQYKANAKLIASAPDGLELAEWILDNAVSIANSDKYLNELMDRAFAHIEKATMKP